MTTFYNQEKAALLQAFVAILNDAEAILDKLEALDTTHKGEPDHDHLALNDLVSDAIELAEGLRDAADSVKEGI
jgi:hypothetical protein